MEQYIYFKAIIYINLKTFDIFI